MLEKCILLILIKTLEEKYYYQTSHFPEKKQDFNMVNYFLMFLQASTTATPKFTQKTFDPKVLSSFLILPFQ